MERRFTEFRAELATGRLTGHAAVFGQETRISDFYEVIDARAFDQVLAAPHDVVLQLEHAGLPLARTTSGTMTLGTDETGLTVDADPADTTAGRDLRELIRRGDMYSMSFGFAVDGEEWSTRDGGGDLRTITRIGRLYDVSVVTFPAYLGTDVALRSLLGDLPRAPRSPRVSARGQAALIRARSRKVNP